MFEDFNFPQINFITLGVLAVSSTLGFIASLSPIAHKIRLVDIPNTRKLHQFEVPLVGGIAIYFSLILIVMVWPLPGSLLSIVFAAVALVILGALDDACGLGIWTRFFVQIVATIFAVEVSSLRILSVGLDSALIQNFVDLFGVFLTVFAVVGLTNGFNLVDGIDGLASGYMLVGLITLLIPIVMIHGYITDLDWAAILIIIMFTFLIVNLSLTPLKKVFLGDAGSLLCGFLMSWSLIFYTQGEGSWLHPVAALWCVSIPVFDTLRVVVQRIERGQSPFTPGRDHLHHLLLDSGVCERKTLLVILGISAIVNALGITITYLVSSEASLILYLLLMCVFAHFVKKSF